MDTIECLLTRRSIKRFKSDPIPDELLEKLLMCARNAPSAHNFQLTRYIVIKDGKAKEFCRLIAAKSSMRRHRNLADWTFEELKQDLSMLPGKGSGLDQSSDESVKKILERHQKQDYPLEYPVYGQVRDAPVVILVCHNRFVPYLHRGKKLRWNDGIYDAMCGANAIITAAHALGLGAQLNTRVTDPAFAKDVHEYFGIPGDYVLDISIQIGYSAIPKMLVDKLPLSELVYYERWGNKEKK